MTTLATWVLVLMFGTSSAPSITNVPGYASKADCSRAGAQYENGAGSSTARYVCIPGPPRS